MKVSEQAWHLRYIRWWQSPIDKDENGVYMPRGQCSYFWRVVWAIVRGMLVLAYIAAFATAAYWALR